MEQIQRQQRLMRNIFLRAESPISMASSRADGVFFCWRHPPSDRAFLERLPMDAVFSWVVIRACCYFLQSTSLYCQGSFSGRIFLRTAKYWDARTGPLARPFARWLAQLTHSLASHCLLRSRVQLRSFVRSLTHSLPSSWKKGSIRCLKTA